MMIWLFVIAKYYNTAMDALIYFVMYAMRVAAKKIYVKNGQKRDFQTRGIAELSSGRTQVLSTK
jgi:uncharacterized membrane protein